MTKVSNRKRRYFANNVDPYIPELWANETLAILYENMVAANLVHRDFEPIFQKYGDTVNTRRPAKFKAMRKDKLDSVTRQDATATNVAVLLNQHAHVNFGFEDVDRTWSMKDLVTEYMQPAGMALASFADKVVLGQYPQFLGARAGLLNGITGTNIKDKFLDLRQAMDNNDAYVDGRNLILSPKTDADALRPEWFTSVSKVGNDAGITKGYIGEKLGFEFYKDQNMSNIQIGNTLGGIGGSNAFQINNAGGYPVGATVLTVDTGAGNIAVGMWVQIGGFPYQVTAHTGTAPTTSITIAPGLSAAVADNTPFDVYTPGAVNNVSGYIAGWQKAIAVDVFTVAPQIGQYCTFNTDPTVYTIIDASLTSITLDRPLVNAIADDDNVNLGPAGAYNLAFHRNAITLAVRPLAPVPDGSGARSATVNWNGLTIRCTIYYSGSAQTLNITLDFLLGVKVLDPNLGAVLLG